MKSSVGGSGILSIERIEGDAPDATPSSLTDLAHAPGYVTPGLSGRWDSKFVGVDLRDARVADDVGAIFRATGAPYGVPLSLFVPNSGQFLISLRFAALDVYRTGDGGNRSHGQSRHDHNTRSIHGDTHSYRGVRVVPSDSGLAPHTHFGTFGRTVAPYRHHLDSRGDNTTPK